MGGFVLNFLFYHSRRQLGSYSFVSFQCGFLGGECGRREHTVFLGNQDCEYELLALLIEQGCVLHH